MKKVLSVLFVVIVLLSLVTPVSARAGKETNEFSVGIVFGGRESLQAAFNIYALQTIPTVMAFRATKGSISWEIGQLVNKMPYSFLTPVDNLTKEVYFGLNQMSGKTYFSSYWGKSVCPKGIEYKLERDGKHMKIQIYNPGKNVLLVQNFGPNVVLSPGKTITLLARFKSFGFGLTDEKGGTCSSVNWNFN